LCSSFDRKGRSAIRTTGLIRRSPHRRVERGLGVAQRCSLTKSSSPISARTLLRISAKLYSDFKSREGRIKGVRSNPSAPGKIGRNRPSRVLEPQGKHEARIIRVIYRLFRPQGRKCQYHCRTLQTRKKVYSARSYFRQISRGPLHSSATADAFYAPAQ